MTKARLDIEWEGDVTYGAVVLSRLWVLIQSELNTSDLRVTKTEMYVDMESTS